MPDRNARRRTGLILCASLIVGLSACWPYGPLPVADPALPDEPAAAPIATAPAGSAELFASHCSACHGPDGSMVAGVTNAVSIAHPDFLRIADDDYLFAAIARGRPGANSRGKPGSKMPAFGHPDGRILEDDQIRLLVAYLRSLQRVASTSLAEFSIADGNASAGETIYASNCASCHGADGWGEIGPRLAGETFQSSASPAYIRQTLLDGRPGTAMPAFDFDDRQMADLIAFLRSFGAEDTG